jgi:uncharacterized protein (TIGR02217 family)
MSASVLPSLAGLDIGVTRTPIWSTNKQYAVSGARTAAANWSYPKWQWELTWNLLRSDPDLHELQDLIGFFNSMRGGFDWFLFEAPDDSSVTGQVIGLGDGATLSYQLVRTFGNFTEPVWAPNAVSKVYVDGTDMAGHWTVSNWGTSAPGLLTFDSAPDEGTEITADFSYYFACEFVDDQIDFPRFMEKMYSAESVKFLSYK